jgi:hypothetical protein
MKKCSAIIFSRNRPLQLTLCLQTLLNHCSDILEISDVTVLYRNDEEYQKSFDNLMSGFPQISFKKEENFKKDLLSLLPHKNNISWGENEKLTPIYAIFLTDDTIFTRDFSIKEVISTLVKNKDCIGFSLRLGNNTSQCYPYNCEQAIPKTDQVLNNIVKYNWQTAEYDFNYCLELSSSVYLLENVIDILENCEYYSPNSLESTMSSCCLEDKPNLLMFKMSVAFSSPLNKVQATHPNRSGDLNPSKLREIYEKGYRFELQQFDNYINRGAHEIPKNMELININGK